MQLALAAVGALVVIAILLLLLFNSFRLTFIIVCAVPYVLIGVLPGLAFTGNWFGFMAILGTVALLGVFVNHKVFLHRSRFRADAARLLRAGRDPSSRPRSDSTRSPYGAHGHFGTFASHAQGRAALVSIRLGKCVRLDCVDSAFARAAARLDGHRRSAARDSTALRCTPFRRRCTSRRARSRL